MNTFEMSQLQLIKREQKTRLTRIGALINHLVDYKYNALLDIKDATALIKKYKQRISAREKYNSDNRVDDMSTFDDDTLVRYRIMEDENIKFYAKTTRYIEKANLDLLQAQEDFNIAEAGEDTARKDFRKVARELFRTKQKISRASHLTLPYTEKM